MADPSREPERDTATGDGPGLRSVALPTFHVTVLVALGLTLLHVAGALGEALAGLETLVGVLLYGLLWGVTWWTNRRWLATTTGASTWPTLRSGLAWGAVTGVAFLVGLLVTLAVATDVPWVTLAVLSFAGVVASAVVGAVVGGAFALLDTAIERVTAAVTPAARLPEARAPGASDR